jgi:6-phosphogluconolactonase
MPQSNLSNYVHVHDNLQSTVEAYTLHIIAVIESLADSRPFITIGLSGASVVEPLTNHLIKHKEKLSKYTEKLKFFLCDERFVAPDSDDSNLNGYIKCGLFKSLGISDENVLAIKADAANVDQCAVDYDTRMRKLLNENGGFDILLLGVGPDGHTCSLFPGHKLFTEADGIKEAFVSISDSPKPPPQRITVTLNYINNSSHALFLAFGEAKAAILKRILIDKDKSLPSANVNPKNGSLKWYLDKDAAKLL